MNNPTPRFTGIFIPIEILEREDINAFDKVLLSWIDALYCKDHHGCFASNEYLANRLKVEPNTIAKIITKLRKLNLIEDISFDGRTRVIRALINHHVEEAQRNPALDKNPTPIGRPSNPTLDIRPSTPYIESKDENKDKDIAQTARSATQPRSSSGSDITFSFSTNNFENINDKDLNTWTQLYPAVNIQRELLDMIEWIRANPSKSKSKKHWRQFIRGWLQRQNEKSTNRMAYQSAKENKILDKHRGFQKDDRPVHPSRTFDFSNCEEETKCS
jgi:Helix-turn-helix domain